jgi:sortase A
VVFGHSILPQFFNPNNYMAIFSTLHTLELGDAIFVTYGDIKYQYQVIDMFEVQPKDVDVLDQDYNDKYLLLITCTPPGTYLRRLVVKTKLVPFTVEAT